MSAAPKIPEEFRILNKKFSYFNDIKDLLRDGLNFEEQYYIMNKSGTDFAAGIQIKELAIEKKNDKVELWIKRSNLGLLDFGSTWSGFKEDTTGWDDKYYLLEKFVKLPEGYQFINGNEFLKNKEYYLDELKKPKYNKYTSRIQGIIHYYAFKLKTKQPKKANKYEYSANDGISGGPYNLHLNDGQLCVSGFISNCRYKNNFEKFFEDYVVAMRMEPKTDKKGGTRRRRRGSKGGSRKNRRSRKSM